jgi:hypothetical protein
MIDNIEEGTEAKNWVSKTFFLLLWKLYLFLFFLFALISDPRIPFQPKMSNFIFCFKEKEMKIEKTNPSSQKTLPFKLERF